MTQRTYTCTALTDIWTGDADGKPDRLITTGLLGSIRWWFEVLVRGLGGSACDPTRDGIRCPGRQVTDPTKPGHHCVVCELFGCTGWARKFRFEVLDKNGKAKVSQIKKNHTFKLQFTELRPVRAEEWALLHLTLRLIADYGAIGGKTVYKPSDEAGLADLDLTDFELSDNVIKVKRSRRHLPLRAGDVLLTVGSSKVSSIQELETVVSGSQHGEEVEVLVRRHGQEIGLRVWYGKRHHRDYGLLAIDASPNLTNLTANIKNVLPVYVTNDHRRTVDHDDFAWASLENFWCVPGKYLSIEDADRSSFNRVVGRPESKKCRDSGKVHDPPQKCPKTRKHPRRHSDQNPATEIEKWLAGQQQESKKVFSFKDPPRTFGFVRSKHELHDIQKRLKEKAWKDLKDEEFQTFKTILDNLLR